MNERSLLTIRGIDDLLSESFELLPLGVVLLVELLPNDAQKILDVVAAATLTLSCLSLELNVIAVVFSGPLHA